MEFDHIKDEVMTNWDITQGREAEESWEGREEGWCGVTREIVW